MLVYQGVIKDVDGDGIQERFSIKDSLDKRLNIIRNNFSGNYIKAYSYIDGDQSTKDVFVSNESWYEVTLEADFMHNDGEILYNIDTYINGELYRNSKAYNKCCICKGYGFKRLQQHI